MATATVEPSSLTVFDGEINGEINREINEEINLTKTDKEILKSIRNNPHIKRQELLSSLKIGKSTLDRSIKKLKETGLLIRVGSNKTGYWRLNIGLETILEHMAADTEYKTLEIVDIELELAWNMPITFDEKPENGTALPINRLQANK